MATRLYTANQPQTYNVATYRGAWDDTSTVSKGRFADTKFGSVTSNGVAETSSTNNHDWLVYRFTSEGILDTATLSGTLDYVVGCRKENAGFIPKLHLHIFVTQGDSDTVRGTLLTDHIGPNLPTASSSIGETSVALTSVDVQPGDRIVVEIGARSANTNSTSTLARIRSGGTSGDLTAGDDPVATDKSGWFEFSFTLPDAPAPGSALVGGVGMGTNF